MSVVAAPSSPASASLPLSTPVSSPPSFLQSPSSQYLSQTCTPTPCPRYRQNEAYDERSDDESMDTAEETATEDNAGERTHRTRRPYTRRVSTRRKLTRVVKVLQRCGWSFQDFVYAWATEQHTIDGVRAGSYKGRRQTLLEVVRTLQSDHSIYSEDIPSACRHELSQLMEEEAFGTFKAGMSVDAVDYCAAVQAIEKRAPTWHAFILRCLENERQGRALKNREALWRRLYFVTSVVCFSRAKKRSNTLPTCVGLYLQGSGVHRRVIEVLAGFGMCHTYHHINSRMGEISQLARVRHPPYITSSGI